MDENTTDNRVIDIRESELTTVANPRRTQL
jgi:hypothetical protein